MSTILKWAGNKTAVMPELIKHLPAGSRLVEPFAGSCAVMMATDYPHYLVADINHDLINLYQVIREDVNSFIHLVEHIFSKFTTEEDYYKCRQFFNTVPLEPIEKAAYFLFLNRHCYRGLCRYNQRGLFNVPYGNYKNLIYPLTRYAHLLKRLCAPPLSAPVMTKRWKCCWRVMWFTAIHLMTVLLAVITPPGFLMKTSTIWPLFWCAGHQKVIQSLCPIATPA